MLIYSNSLASRSYKLVATAPDSLPVAICKDITIQLDNAGSASITPNDVDNGSYSLIGISSMTISQSAFGCSNVGTNLVDLIVSDSIGNSDTCQAIVTVQDTIVPFIFCPPNIIVNNDSGQCGAIVNYTEPEAIDNCPPLPPKSLQTISFLYTGAMQQWTIPLGVTSIRIKAVGARGGSNDGAFGGGGAGGKGASVEGDFTVIPGEVLNILAAGHGEDAFNEFLSLNTGGGGGSFVWKDTGDTLLIAAGGGSGFGSCAQQPGTPGLSTLGGSGNGGLGGTSCGANQGGGGGAGWLSDGGNTPAYSDIGGISPLNGGAGGTGGTPVNGFTSTDGGFGGGGGGGGNCGGPGGGGGYTGGDGGDNILCGSQYASGGMSYNIGTNQAGTTGVNDDHGFVEISWDPPGAFAATQIGGLPPGSFFPVGTTTQIYIASDYSGNTDTCIFTVTVQDTELPIAVCQDITVQLDVQGNASIIAADVDGGSSDNCGIDSLTLDNSFFTCENLGANEVILTVTDINGNTSTCTAIVTVEDNQIPLFTNCPGDVTLNALTNNCFQNHGWPQPAYIDNCSATLSVYASDSTVSVFDFGTMHFASFPVGTTSVTYELADASGNIDFCSFNVTVNDVQNPTITGCPSNITITGTCNNTANWNPPTASDNCSGVSLTSTHVSGSIFPIGTTTVTYTATDASGNTAVCYFNVTVIAPPLTATITAAPLACNGGENGTATVTITSGCSPYTYSWSTSPVQTGATATGLSVGSYTVAVTDANGSTTELTITLTEPPLLVANAGANAIVYYGYSPYSCTTLTSSANGGVTPYKYVWSTGNTTSSIQACPTSSQNYTLTVTDANGCTSTDVVKVCVVDVRCQNNRVELCHTFPNGTTSTLCVPSYIVPLYLAMGDQLGECGSITSCPDDDDIKETDDKSELSIDGLNLMSYPNPFNLQTTVRFSSAEAGNVEVAVYNMIGVKVATLFNGTVKAKEIHEENFNAEKLSDGIYFVKLITEQGEMKVERMVLSK